MRALQSLLDTVLAALLGTLKWLVLPLGLLLFLQWPLREWVHGYSREANDFGQWIFALYVATSVTAATRAGMHLSADALARHYSPRFRAGLLRFGQLVALAPWAIFVIVSSRQIVLSSIRQLEGFPDTGNPGYWILKLSLWLLAGLVLIAIARDLLGPIDQQRRP